MTLRAEELPRQAVEPPIMGITITGADTSTGAVVTLQRKVGGNPWDTVRGAERLLVVGSTLVRDYETPLNVECTYQLVVHSGTVSGATNTYGVVNTTCHWLQDAFNPQSYVPLACGQHGDEHVPQDLFEAEYTAWYPDVATAADLHQEEMDYQVRKVRADTAPTVTRTQALNHVTPVGSTLPVALGSARQGRSQIDLSVIEDGVEDSSPTLFEELVTRSSILLFRTMPCLATQFGGSAFWQFPDHGQSMPHRHNQQLEGARGRDFYRMTRLTGGVQVRPPAAPLTMPWLTYGTSNPYGLRYRDTVQPGVTYLTRLKQGLMS